MRVHIRIYKTKKQERASRLQKGHDHKGTRGKRKVFYAVHCEIHGKAAFGSVEKIFIVPPVTGRKAKTYGCPMCRAAAKE